MYKKLSTSIHVLAAESGELYGFKCLYAKKLLVAIDGEALSWLVFMTGIGNVRKMLWKKIKFQIYFVPHVLYI